MALSEIPPWLNVQPKDFVSAASAGAEAGLGAARTLITARQVQQQAGFEAAKLSQQERIANMEMQARRDIAEQNNLREQQQIAVQNAYHQAQIGVAKDRLAEVSAIAEQKARDAAMQFADEQGFYKAVSSGKTIPEALGQFPRTPASNVNAIRMAKPPGEASVSLKSEIPGYAKVIQNTGHVQYIPLPPEELNANQKMSQIRLLANLRKDLAANQDDPEAMKRIQESIDLASTIAPAGGRTVPSPTVAGAKYPEGTPLRHKDGKLYIVRNGVPVPESDLVSPAHSDEP